MARALVLALAVSLLAVAGASGADAQTPRVGGTVFLRANEPSCLNDGFGGACEVNGGPFVWDLVFKGAYKLAPDATLRPNLVSKVGFTRKLPFTLTYHIRPEAHWSDGVQISAKDFVFTYWAIRKYRPDPEDPHLTQIRSVRALDAKTVRVVLRARFADWRTFLFDNILPRHALLGEDLTAIWTDRIDNPKTGEPIGSGPFLVERWERGKRLALVRNQRYWGPHPAHLKRLVYRFVDLVSGADPAEVLRKGDVDVYWSGVGRQDDFRPIPGYRARFLPGTNLEHFELRLARGGHPALKIKLVRRALAYGIDRVAIVRSLYGKIDPTLRPLDSLVFRTGSRFYRPNWSGYRYRPNEARRLLGQAGCRRGADAIYVCGGERLSLRFVTTAGVVRRELVLQLVQQQLRQVGIEVRVAYASSVSVVVQILARGDADLALFAYFGPPNLPGLPVADVFRCDHPSNLTGYCQRLVAGDLDQAGRILDEEQRARVLNRADAQLARDVPVIPLFQPPIAVYARSNLRNHVDRFPGHFWNIENWWLAR